MGALLRDVPQAFQRPAVAARRRDGEGRFRVHGRPASSAALLTSGPQALECLTHRDVVELQRAAGNRSVAHVLTIQRQKPQAKAAKKAAAASEGQDAVEKAVEAAKDEAPSTVADRVKDAVQEKLTDPALDKMKKGSADPGKIADAEAAAEELKDKAGAAAEAITQQVLDGYKVGDSLGKRLQKALAVKGSPSFTMPSFDKPSCSLSIGVPKPVAPSISPPKFLFDPSKVGVSWKAVKGTCSFADGGTLTFGGTIDAKGFLDKDFSPRVPTSFGASLKLEYKSSNVALGASYKVSKDPDNVGQAALGTVKVFF